MGTDASSGSAEELPSFEARVSADLRLALAGCMAEQERLVDFVPRRIHVSSRRLERYFDPQLFRTLEATMRTLLEPRLGREALSRIERITVGPEIGQARPDTLYVVCLHQMDGELEELERVRTTTNSILVGWCWDNHHNYMRNARLAAALDVCVPAHHHGRGFLQHANRSTTAPLPLCCAQWSVATLKSLLADHPLDDCGSTAISGRFTEWFNKDNGWGVGTRRRDLVLTYGEGAISEHVQLVLEPNENYAYFTLSAQERLADWRRHRFSLCLPVRSDLSLRFFDAIAAGQLPIVDRELEGRVLDDLAPSLIAGRDYLLVDVASPPELVEARQTALDNWDTRQRKVSSQRVLKHHLLEHRLALMAEACLLALGEGTGPKPLPTARPEDDCLRALLAGEDDAAVALLASLLQQGHLGAALFELLAGLDRRLTIKDSPRPNDEQRAAMGWAGVGLVDQVRAEVPKAGLPDWLPVLEERFCRLGALALQPLARNGGPAGRQARQRAITLMLRLGGLHQPCPTWVVQMARSLLQSDCADGQSLPEISRERTELLLNWRQKMEGLGGLDGELEKEFERALTAAARRLVITDSKKPLVSVFMMTYNHEDYISQAIESVLSQKCSFDIELIIGDDASTDRTPRICFSYSNTYASTIRYFGYQENSPANYWDAFAHCQGEYIAICEGDDYWTSPDKLEKQVTFLEKSPAHMLVSANTVMVDKDNNVFHTTNLNEGPLELEDLTRDNKLGAATCATVFRRECGLDKTREFINRCPYGDWATWIVCLSHGKGFVLSDQLGAYRVHANGIFSSLDRVERANNNIKMYTEIIKFYPHLRTKIQPFFEDLLGSLSEDKLDQWGFPHRKG